MLKRVLTSKTLIFTVLIVIILFFVPKLTEMIMILFASYVIAAALNPYVNKTEKIIKNRALATLTILTISGIILAAVLLPVVVACYKEIELFAVSLPRKITTLYHIITHTTIYGKTIASYIPIGNIAETGTNLAHNLFAQSWTVTMAAGQMVFVFLALTMFIYYIILDKDYLKNKFLEFFPPKLKEKAGMILYNITTKVGNYVRAQILSMITVGFMVTVEVALLGIDYPILLGIIAGICDIIPLLGPTISIMTIIFVGYQLGWAKIVIAIILFVLIQQISNYVIRPFLFGKFMKLDPINIMVAIFVAEKFLGVWGVILSPAIAATICVLIDELYLSPMNENDSGEISAEQIIEG